MASKWAHLFALTLGVAVVGTGVGGVLPRMVPVLNAMHRAADAPPPPPPPAVPAPIAPDPHQLLVPAPAPVSPARPSVSPTPSLPPVAPSLAQAEPRPRLPNVITPGSTIDAVPPPYVVGNLPNIIRPTERGKPSIMSGTGFFIGPDASVMTVAHVVKDCRGIQIASRHLRLSPAQLIAADEANDLALLRAPGVKPPATLAFAPRPTGSARLDILGYPGDGDQFVPTGTLGILRTERPPFEQTDKRDLLWMDAPDVRHGFSGGPVLAPGGDVIGLINGFVSARRVGQDREYKFTFGASTRMISDFLRRAAPAVAFDGGQHAGMPSAEVADKAVVHIYCTL